MALCERCMKRKTTFSWEKYCFRCQAEVDLERRKEAIMSGDESSIYHDTTSDKYIICPYCGNSFEADEPFEDGESYECDECGEEFVVDAEWSVTYSTRKVK